ncbi:hypothetical protein NUG39_24635 (plasmid) [Citrobacter youngae]|nr:hypothetical protein [Citrobacter youngae]UUX57069.1 hypothetical protein NUG39_24635 [Citrobacter youngae]
MVVFVRGLLANDPGEISAAVTSVPEVLNTVQSGDGFYKDGSFIQHKDLPYSGTYGQVLLNGLGLIKNSVAGTPWDFSVEDNRRIYDVIRQAFLPLLHEGKMGTVAKLAMRQPFVLFKGLTFQKLCLPGAFRPGDHHNKMLRPGLCVVHASPQYL